MCKLCFHDRTLLLLLLRKTAEDELAMREYLMEGDLISAEVQMVRHDGAVDLHTRNLKYV